MLMIPQVSQLLPTQDILGWILQIVFLGFFVIFMFYGQRFQMYIMLRDIESHLRRLKFIRDEGRKLTVETIKEIGKPQGDPTERVDQFLEYIAITPQSMDPSGIVWKLEHLLDVRDVRFKDEVKLMAPEAGEAQLNSLENTLEAAMVLNVIYKVILIMREAEALASALKAFATGQPIGDGAGALVAAKLMHGHKTRKIAKDIVAATVPLEGRMG